MIIYIDGLEVDGSYDPGKDSYVWGRPEDCHDGQPDEFEIHTVKLIDTEEFLEAGHKLSDNLTEIADSLYERIIESARDDYRN